MEAMLPLLVPVFCAKAAWWVAGLTVVIGAGSSLYTGNWEIFSRTGSLLIVYALLLALFDYTGATKDFFGSINNVLGKEFIEDEERRVKEFVREELAKYGLEKSEQEIAYIADQKREMFWEGLPSRYGEVFRMKSVTSEIGLAILGTLISAFGSLIG